MGLEKSIGSKFADILSAKKYGNQSIKYDLSFNTEKNKIYLPTESGPQDISFRDNVPALGAINFSVFFFFDNAGNIFEIKGLHPTEFENDELYKLNPAGKAIKSLIEYATQEKMDKL